MRSVLVLLLSTRLLGQNPKPDTVFCDCDVARVVMVGSGTKIGKTTAPPGPGVKQEISEHKQRSKYTFDKEHHSSWYKLIMNSSGHLCFDIIPSRKDDDYDFMLFRGTRENFCDSLANYKINPVRACISRDKEDLEGITGQNYKGKKELVREGVGDAYVTPLHVNKGEIYYLVLDNVYSSGGGHTIQFYFEEPVSVKGIITNEKDQPLAADIALTNAKGDTVKLTKSKADGSYEFTTLLRQKVNYVLNFYNDSSFIFAKNVFLQDSAELKNIKTVLPELKKGAKHPIGNINFFGNSPNYIPNAVPSINNLLKLMKKNPALKIQIEGHTNGCNPGVQVLSEQRAMKIKEYLVRKGVGIERIKTIGKGCKEMLFPLTDKTPFAQQEQNRRVEVLVLEY